MDEMYGAWSRVEVCEKIGNGLQTVGIHVVDNKRNFGYPLT